MRSIVTAEERWLKCPLVLWSRGSGMVFARTRLLIVKRALKSFNFVRLLASKFAVVAASRQLELPEIP